MRIRLGLLLGIDMSAPGACGAAVGCAGRSLTELVASHGHAIQAVFDPGAPRAFMYTATPSHPSALCAAARQLQTLALKRTGILILDASRDLAMTDALPGPSLSGSAGRSWSLSGSAGSHWSGLYVLLKVPAPLYAVCHGLRARGALLTDR